MSLSRTELLAQLRATFRVEAQELLQAIQDGLLQLEQQALPHERRRAVVESVFRATHSLKGAAGAVCQSLQDIFAGCKRAGAQGPQPQNFDAPGAARDRQPAGTLHARAVPEARAPAAVAVTTLDAPATTVRVRANALEQYLLPETEEMLAATLSASRQVQSCTRSHASWTKLGASRSPAPSCSARSRAFETGCMRWPALPSRSASRSASRRASWWTRCRCARKSCCCCLL